MDSMAVLSALICSLLIISAEVPLFNSNESDTLKYKGGFYAPMFLFTLFTLCSIACAWIMNGSNDDSELASSIAFGTRL